MLGPLLELELIKNIGSNIDGQNTAERGETNTVPQGLKISPAQFLSAPEDGRFRKMIEGDKHKHHIVRIVKKEGGYELEIIDSFIEIRDKFCFETEKFCGKPWCYITTVFWGFGERAVCEHDALVKFVVSHHSTVCPHRRGALKLNILCKSLVETFMAGTENIKMEFPEEEFQLDTYSDFQLMTSAEDGASFSFKELCKAAGRKTLGNLPRNIKEKNCKRNVDIDCRIMKRVDNIWESKLILDEILPRCLHMSDCEEQSEEITEEQMTPAGPSVANENSGSSINFGGERFLNQGTVVINQAERNQGSTYCSLL